MPAGPRRGAVAASARYVDGCLAAACHARPGGAGRRSLRRAVGALALAHERPRAFPETSGPVSAIAGAPAAGGPRSARASVSAQHTRPEIPDEAIDESTIIASRRRTQWSLVPPVGGAMPLSAEIVIVGRRPVADPEYPGAQLVAIQDGTDLEDARPPRAARGALVHHRPGLDQRSAVRHGARHRGRGDSRRRGRGG